MQFRTHNLQGGRGVLSVDQDGRSGMGKQTCVSAFQNLLVKSKFDRFLYIYIGQANNSIGV